MRANSSAWARSWYARQAHSTAQRQHRALEADGADGGAEPAGGQHEQVDDDQQDEDCYSQQER
jgi:hypothetical protein